MANMALGALAANPRKRSSLVMAGPGCESSANEFGQFWKFPQGISPTVPLKVCGFFLAMVMFLTTMQSLFIKLTPFSHHYAHYKSFTLLLTPESCCKSI